MEETSTCLVCFFFFLALLFGVYVAGFRLDGSFLREGGCMKAKNMPRVFENTILYESVYLASGESEKQCSSGTSQCHILDSHPPIHTIAQFHYKYPNPHATHVHTVDTISRTVDPVTGIIRSERVIGIQQGAPKWVTKVSLAASVATSGRTGKLGESELGDGDLIAK